MQQILSLLSALFILSSAAWSAEVSLKPIQSIENLGDGVSDWGGYTDWEYLKLSSNGKYLAVRSLLSSGGIRSIFVWNTNTWKMEQQLESQLAGNDIFSEMEFSPTSDEIATSGGGFREGNSISVGTAVFDLKSGNKKFIIKKHQSNAYELPVWSPSGKDLIVAECPGHVCTAYIYKLTVDGFKEIYKVENLSGNGLEFSPTGNKAYLTRTDGTWVIWDVAKEIASEVKMDIDGVISFLKDKNGISNEMIVVSTEKNQVRVYREDSMSLLYSLNIDKTARVSASLDTKGQSYVFIRTDEPVANSKQSKLVTLQVLDLQTGKKVNAFKVTVELDGTRIMSQSLKNTSYYVVAQEKRSVLEVWNYIQGKKVAELEYGSSTSAKQIFSWDQPAEQPGLLAVIVKYSSSNSRERLGKILIWNLNQLKNF